MNAEDFSKVLVLIFIFVGITFTVLLSTKYTLKENKTRFWQLLISGFTIEVVALLICIYWNIR